MKSAEIVAAIAMVGVVGMFAYMSIDS
jgi:hypothetical protein